MNALRDRMQRDIARLIGQLPVKCGPSADAQTIDCALLSQRNEVRFAAPGLMREDSIQIIVQAASFAKPPPFHSVLWVSGHRYRVRLCEPIDLISLRITLDRSDK